MVNLILRGATMQNTRHLISLTLCTAFLASCAEMNSIHRLRGVNPLGQTQLIDAKQRAIVMVPNKTAENGDPMFRMCAEPSPDVFSIYALAATADGNIETNPAAAGGAPGQTKAGGSFAFGSSENASTIERTQTINLMRESMFRTCERYLSGAIDKGTMQIQAARDQRAMVAVLAIEQLTGVVKRKPTILSSEVQATLVTANKELTDQQVRDKKNDEKSEDALNKAQTAFDKASSDYKALNEGKCDTILTTPVTPPASGGTISTQTTTTTGLPSGGTQEVVKNEEQAKPEPSEDAAAATALAASQSQCRAAKNTIESTQATLTSKKSAREDAKTTLKATQDLLKSMASTMHTVSAGGEGSGDAGSNPYSQARIARVATAVENITFQAFDTTTEMVYVCTDVVSKFGNYLNPTPVQEKIIASCLTILNLKAETTKSFIEDQKKLALETERYFNNPDNFNKINFVDFWKKVNKDGSPTEVDSDKLANEMSRVQQETGTFIEFSMGLANAKTKSELKRIFNTLDTLYKSKLAME